MFLKIESVLGLLDGYRSQHYAVFEARCGLERATVVRRMNASKVCNAARSYLRWRVRQVRPLENVLYGFQLVSRRSLLQAAGLTYFQLAC